MSEEQTTADKRRRGAGTMSDETSLNKHITPIDIEQVIRVEVTTLVDGVVRTVSCNALVIEKTLTGPFENGTAKLTGICLLDVRLAPTIRSREQE